MASAAHRAIKDFIIRLAIFTDNRDVRRWPIKIIEYTDTRLKVSIACRTANRPYCWILQTPLPSDYDGREIYGPVPATRWTSCKFSCASRHNCANTIEFRRVVSTWTLAGRLSPGVFQKNNRGFFSIASATTRRCYVCNATDTKNLHTWCCKARRCVDTILGFARGAYSHWVLTSLVDTAVLCKDTYNVIMVSTLRLVIPADLL